MLYNPQQVRTETNYEYRNGLIGIQSDIEEKTNVLINNFLTFSTYFESSQWSRGEMQNIAKQLEETGKYFAKLQGFGSGPTTQGNYDTGRIRFNTGNLVNGIKADSDGRWVRFYNDATNSRGQPYAGHLEYGFHDRGGNFIQARPFMRPAFYAVANASKGRLTSIMKDLIERAWSGNGFSGISNETFGHAKAFNTSGYSVVQKMSNYYGRGSGRRLKEVRSSQFRRNFSAKRGSSRNTKEARSKDVRRDSRASVRNKSGTMSRKHRIYKKRNLEYGWHLPQGYKGGSKLQQDKNHPYRKGATNVSRHPTLYYDRVEKRYVDSEAKGTHSVQQTRTKVRVSNAGAQYNSKAGRLDRVETSGIKTDGATRIISSKTILPIKVDPKKVTYLEP